MELSGSQNTTYYFFIRSQAIKIENLGNAEFGMDWSDNPNEKILNQTYYFTMPIYLRNCIQGEIFSNKTNKFLIKKNNNKNNFFLS